MVCRRGNPSGPRLKMFFTTAVSTAPEAESSGLAKTSGSPTKGAGPAPPQDGALVMVTVGRVRSSRASSFRRVLARLVLDVRRLAVRDDGAGVFHFFSHSVNA